jgi:hypothetical protein
VRKTRAIYSGYARPVLRNNQLLPVFATDAVAFSCQSADVEVTIHNVAAATQPAPERRRWARLSLAIFVRGANGQGREFLEFCTLLNESARRTVAESVGLNQLATSRRELRGRQGGGIG